MIALILLTPIVLFLMAAPILVILLWKGLIGIPSLGPEYHVRKAIKGYKAKAEAKRHNQLAADLESKIEALVNPEAAADPKAPPSPIPPASSASAPA